MKLVKKQNNSNEDGQSMLEFILVLPVFLLMLFMIIDFGWLFYNMNNVQTATRNAARIACVEFTDTCFNATPEGNWDFVDTKEYSLSDYVANTSSYTVQEQDILDQVSNILTSNQDTTTVTISYSGGPTVEERIEGDVTVAVKYKINSITGIIAVGQDGMYRDFTAASTFKVEKNG